MAVQGPPSQRRRIVVEAPSQPAHLQWNGDPSSRRVPPLAQQEQPPTAAGLFAPSAGARLTHEQICLASQEGGTPPPREDEHTLRPVLLPALCNPTVPQQARLVVPPDVHPDDVLPIFLMRRPGMDTSSASSSAGTASMPQSSSPERAYCLLPFRRPIKLEHGDPNFPRDWGHVFYAVAYPRVVDSARADNNSSNDVPTFRVPNEQETAQSTAADAHPVHVVIKRIDKGAVQHALGLLPGGTSNTDMIVENPYKEIARLQQLGDNVHVLSILDALEDDQYLYIVTPRAMGGSLVDVIWNTSNANSATTATATASSTRLSPQRIGEYFCQLLRILQYLEQQGIHHRDLSPDNLLFLHADQRASSLVAMDLAMSIKIPTVPVPPVAPLQQQQQQQQGMAGAPCVAQQQRTLIADLGRSGTRRWLCPEIWCRMPFDGVAADLWSAMVILYNMQTRHVLYHEPFPADALFRYFCFGGGLSDDANNERAMEIMMEIFYGRDGDGSLYDRIPNGAAVRARDRQAVLHRAQLHLEFTPAMKELFAHSFQADPHERWTLAQVMESAYVAEQHQQRQQLHETSAAHAANGYHREHG